MNIDKRDIVLLILEVTGTLTLLVVSSFWITIPNDLLVVPAGLGAIYAFVSLNSEMKNAKQAAEELKSQAEGLSSETEELKEAASSLKKISEKLP